MARTKLKKAQSKVASTLRRIKRSQYLHKMLTFTEFLYKTGLRTRIFEEKEADKNARILLDDI